MKNQNLLLTGILTIAISCPAFADIAANANSAKCDNGTLDTYQGESTLQAQWTANTINLVFYDGETKLSSGTCTYDGGIELPEDPTKTGYEFDGWKVRRAAAAPSQPQQTTFDLSTLSEYIDTSGDDYSSKNFAGSFCNYGNNDAEDEIYSYTCNESIFTGLSTGEWKTTFEYGTVKGEALCSSTPGTWAQTGTPTETGGGKYCWCKATGFAEPNSSSYQNVSSSSWVFYFDRDSADDCADYCAYECSYVVNFDGDFRRAVFGVTE
jgi:uncharacterized repeat protein (TIGR02543 family)